MTYDAFTFLGAHNNVTSPNMPESESSVSAYDNNFPNKRSYFNSV